MTKIKEFWIKYGIEDGYGTDEHCVHAHNEEDAVRYVCENISSDIKNVSMVGERTIQSIPESIAAQPTVVLD